MKKLISRYVVPAIICSTLLAIGCARTPEPVETNPAPEPSAPERHVDLDGQPYFRDLGGYETADGRAVKWGQVYRSGELPRLSDEDVAKLEELGITKG